MHRYLLAPCVYSCATEDHVVLLDLARDKYFGVSSSQMGALMERVRGWPSLSGSHAPSGRRAEAVFSKMLAAGMLATDADIGKDATPITIETVNETLVAPALDWRPKIAARDVIRFLNASAHVALSLKYRGLQTAVAAARKRKAAGLARTGQLDIEVARRATGAFIGMRPLLFGAQDACLYDSLVLIRFLSYYHQYPTCVIGVQTGRSTRKSLSMITRNTSAASRRF